ncbi:hypothetical protein [Quadrisphaera sp. INWT6]|uniref:hypothetical protein n=1 Tax=Quadrisphaera sp. INWT6 TaxID=2596917 RepID=UPI0018923183|nr:hypothetical protein [Quadrisphaera sp. INWT6]MBF5081468.1 hypothetical protein [Quadrisphaera sp. INWT6]
MASEDADDSVDLDDLDAPADDADDTTDAAAAGPRETATARGRGAARVLGAWPERVPAWARGPAAVVVVALLAGGAGALAGSAHREARDERTAVEQALTVGQAFVAGQGLRSGQLRAELRLVLVNHGEQAVAVRLQGLTTPHQGTTTPPDEVQVAAGEVVAAPLEVAVDCSAVGLAPDTAAAGPTAVLASVRPGGDGTGGTGAAGAVDVRLPVLAGIARALEEQIAGECGGTALLEPQTGWLWKDDGALRVTTTVPALGSAVQLVLDGSDGLGATADPPLPRSLGPGETAVTDLRVDPDCDVVGDGSLSWLDLQARDAQGGTTTLGRSSGGSDPVSGVQPWLARQVALACG